MSHLTLVIWRVIAAKKLVNILRISISWEYLNITISQSQDLGHTFSHYGPPGWRIRKWYRQNFLWPELTPYSFYPTELLFRVWHLRHLLQICRFFWIRCILRSHETDKFLTYAILTISNITSLAFTDKWSLGIMAYSISITSMSFRWTLVNI